MDNAAMAPDRRPYGTDTRTARALLLPQLLARTSDFPAHLRRVRAGAIARLELPHRFVQKRLVWHPAKSEYTPNRLPSIPSTALSKKHGWPHNNHERFGHEAASPSPAPSSFRKSYVTSKS